MELRHLRYFLAVAEQSHFRQAAESLHVSQPTLSQQVKDLEDELGIALFERTGRRARLTQAGRLYQQYAQRAINVLEEGKTALDELDGLVRGSLTVGVVQTVNASLTPAVVAQFAQAYPQVKLQVEELSASQIESGIRDGRLDVGISFAPADDKGLSVEPLLREEFVLAVSPGHPLQDQPAVKIAQLKETPLCLLDQGFCTRRMIDTAFAKAKCSPRVAIEMNSIEGIVAVVGAGGPATILPRLAIQCDRLQTLRLEKPAIHRTVSILQTQSQTLSRARAEFIQMLHRQLSPMKVAV